MTAELTIQGVARSEYESLQQQWPVDLQAPRWEPTAGDDGSIGQMMLVVPPDGRLDTIWSLVRPLIKPQTRCQRDPAYAADVRVAYEDSVERLAPAGAATDDAVPDRVAA